MARAKKVDANQPEIVECFRSLGCLVHVTNIGGGFPDLVVQRRNAWTNESETWLVEVKDGSLSKSRRALTPAQVTFHQAWDCEIVESIEDCYKLLGHPLA